MRDAFLEGVLDLGTLEVTGLDAFSAKGVDGPGARVDLVVVNVSTFAGVVSGLVPLTRSPLPRPPRDAPLPARAPRPPLPPPRPPRSAPPPLPFVRPRKAEPGSLLLKAPQSLVRGEGAGPLVEFAPLGPDLEDGVAIPQYVDKG